MNILIVESDARIAGVWRAAMAGAGMTVTVVEGQAEAIKHILFAPSPDVIVLDLVLSEGSALAIADFASYRSPEARVIFVTDTSFFSDGSIFEHAKNACAFVQSHIPPTDLVAMVEYHANATVPVADEAPRRQA